jgi:hypothetical protein
MLNFSCLPLIFQLKNVKRLILRKLTEIAFFANICYEMLSKAIDSCWALQKGIAKPLGNAKGNWIVTGHFFEVVGKPL